MDWTGAMASVRERECRAEFQSQLQVRATHAGKESNGNSSSNDKKTKKTEETDICLTLVEKSFVATEMNAAGLVDCCRRGQPDVAVVGGGACASLAADCLIGSEVAEVAQSWRTCTARLSSTMSCDRSNRQ